MKKFQIQLNTQTNQQSLKQLEVSQQKNKISTEQSPPLQQLPNKFLNTDQSPYNIQKFRNSEKENINQDRNMPSIKNPKQRSKSKNNIQNLKKSAISKNTRKSYYLPINRIKSKESNTENFSKVSEAQSGYDSTQTNSKVKNKNLLECCFNHPQKKAKYFINQNEKPIQICSKCAVDYALQGIKVFQNSVCVQQFQSRRTSHSEALLKDQQNQFSDPDKSISDKTQQKKLELDTFLQQINQTYNLNKEIQSILLQFQQQFNNYYQNQYSENSKFFDSIIDMISKTKSYLLAQLDSKREKFQFEFDKKQQSLVSVSQEMENIQQDIQQNMFNIIYNMETQPFQLILNKYNEKLQNYILKNQEGSLFTNQKNQQQCLQFLNSDYMKNNFVENLIEYLQKNCQNYKESNASYKNFSTVESENVLISFDNREIFHEVVWNKQIRNKEISIKTYTPKQESKLKEFYSIQFPLKNNIKEQNQDNKSERNRSSSQKYINLLEKINENQNKILRNAQSLKQLNPIQKKEDEYDKDQPFIRQNNFQEFFSTKDNYQNQDLKQNQQSYQKTLFNSPYFKNI